MTTLRKVLVQRLAEHREAIAARERGDAPRNFITTGIPTWDKNGGLEPGVLTLIGGPSGEGKSAVLLHLLKAVASTGTQCLALSFEDPAGKTADRTLAQATGESSHVLGRMQYHPAVLDRLEAAVRDASGWAELVEFQAGLVTARQAMDTIRASSARLIMVDYAQAFPDEVGGSRERMLSQLAWDLSVVAQERNAAVVLFSQIKHEIIERGKAVYDRTGKIDGYRPGPGTSDFGWSAAMGQRAKVVIYLFRPGRWAKAHGLQAKDDTMELIFAKANFGVEATLTVGWHGPTSSLCERPKA